MFGEFNVPEQFSIPPGYQMIPDNQLCSTNCSRSIMISNGSRTASIPAASTTDGTVKTVLGTVPIEKLEG